MTFTFTLYSHNDFSVKGKLVGRKPPISKPIKTKPSKQTTRKKQKSSLIRIPRKSVPLEDQQPSVIVETPILVEIERLNYDMKLLQRFYEQQRHGEFCKSAREILNKKLHPDFCKFGHFLGLGSCLPDVIHDAFVGQIGVTWEQEHRVLVDGFVTKPIRRYYYFNKIMPDLMELDWFVRLHGKSNPNFSAELRSFYTSLVFIVEQDDGRVWCHYEFVTQALIGGFWVDVA